MYFRTLFVMLVSLFTSRVVLRNLGVENYGIYNVVGGFVSMFAVISGAQSSSISRFLTFELGKGDKEKLSLIFSTSVNIQLLMGVLIFIVGESFGVWFLNYKMNIAEHNLYAANWVLQFSIGSFLLSLITLPYTASIIANEKMSSFAYISMIEVLLKLGIVYLLNITSHDKLTLYSFLLFVVSVITTVIYVVYCRISFPECSYKFRYDKSLAKEMTKFAGWSFLTNGAYIFNTQGVNLLINLFFGVVVNAARGIAFQIEQTIVNFVNNFTVALNPQIIKTYAQGDKKAMFSLICRGAKFSYLLLFCLALPLLFETNIVIRLWLTIVPEHTVSFFRLSIIGTMLTILGNTGYTACMATGNIKKYVIIITTIGSLVFPITWVLYKLGLAVESCYYVYIFIYIVLLFVRLFIMKGLLNFSPLLFVREVLFKVVIVSLCSIILPSIIVWEMEESVLRLLLNSLICVLSGIGFSLFIGLSQRERTIMFDTVKKHFFTKR